MFETYQVCTAETFVSGQIPVNGPISKDEIDHATMANLLFDREGNHVIIIDGLQILKDEITNHCYCFHIKIIMKDYEDDKTKVGFPLYG